MSIYLFDIDGTLADIEHREHLISPTNTKRDWENFFKNAVADKPIYPVLRIAKTLHAAGETIGYITARPEWTRTPITDSWLTSYELPVKNLFMRSDDDYRPDTIVKKELLQKIRAAGFVPQVVFEDRQGNVDMFVEEGIPVLHVRTFLYAPT